MSLMIQPTPPETKMKPYSSHFVAFCLLRSQSMAATSDISRRSKAMRHQYGTISNILACRAQHGVVEYYSFSSFRHSTTVWFATRGVGGRLSGSTLVPKLPICCIIGTLSSSEELDTESAKEKRHNPLWIKAL